MSAVEKTVKRSIAFTIDLICKINFVCTSTWENAKKEFVGESKEPTARLFAQFHSPQTERMKKECISSFVLNRVIKLRVLPPKQGMYFTALAIYRGVVTWVCFSAEIGICILGIFCPKPAGSGFQTLSAHLWFTYPKYWSSIPCDDEFVLRCLVVWPMRRSAAVPEFLYTTFFQYDTLKSDTHEYNSFFLSH